MFSVTNGYELVELPEALANTGHGSGFVVRSAEELNEARVLHLDDLNHHNTRMSQLQS